MPSRAAGDPAIAYCFPDEDPDSLAVRAACMGDGGPAVNASIWGPFGLAVGPDGSIYFSDGNYVVRKVSPNGIVTTIAGGGWASLPCDYQNPSYGWTDPACGDGGPARLAGMDVPFGVTLGSDGSVYFVDAGNSAVRRIEPNGVISRVAGSGTGSGGFSGDGGPATSALISGGGLALGPDGSLFIGGLRIRRVGPNGIITTIAGTGGVSSCGVPNPPTCQSGLLATQAPISLTQFGQVVAASDGSVYFPTWQGDHRVQRIVPFFRSYDSTGVVIASDDGSEVYEFDPNGRHLRTRDSQSNRILFTLAYDGAGRLASITDADNNVTTLQRNGSGDLTTIVSPFGQQTPVTFDARGYLATITNPAGEVITAVHDTLGLLQTLRDAKNNPPQRFSYDSLGRLVADTASGVSFQTLVRTETDTSVSVTLTSALNRTQTFKRIELPTGSILHLETDQAGLSTQAQQSTNGTTVMTSPDGTVSTMTEKADPRFGMQTPFLGAFSVALPSGLTLAGSSTRKVTMTDPFNPLSMTSQVDSLTVNGRTFNSTWNTALRTLTEVSAVGRQTVTLLDSTGRVTEERVTGVAPVQYTYGARGFLTTVRQSGRILQYDYDSTGRVKKVTDPLGRTEQFLYDSVGRVKTQTLPDGRQILYSYDANGNLTSLTPPTKPQHTFFYTTGDQDSIYAPPPTGLSSFQTKYSYNLDQQVTQILRPDSQAIVIGYDGFGRPNGLTLPNGSTTIGYHPTSGLLNSLTSATGGSLGFTYNGALPTLATWTGTVAGSVGYTYDANFRITALTVNGANSIALGYDNDNLLTSAGSLTLTRDPQNGRLTGTTLGSLTTTHTYDDSVGTPKRNTATYSSTTLLDFQYTRDTLDRITQIIENVQGTTQTWNYTYDSVGRLDQVRLNTVLVSDYTYDANGNRTGLTTQGGSVTGTVDDQDRLLTYGTNSYAYSSNGELKLKVSGPDTTRYTYNVLGNLLQVQLPTGTIIDYLVDGQNRRIGRKVNGGLTQGFLYQGQLAPIAELDGSSAVVSRFVYGTRVNVPEYMIKAGVTYRLLTDHLGSVRLVVNTTDGTVAQRIDYDEFGRVTQNTNPGFQPFGFAGGLYDDASKLVRFGARDYAAETGRWAAKDPIRFNGESVNLLTYAGGDPVNAVDPDGLRCRTLGRDLASLIPVVGPAWDAYDDFMAGKYGSAAFNSGMAALDAIGAGALARGGWRLGSNSWRATKGAWRDAGLVQPGQVVHHAFVPQRDFGPDWEWLFNQWWNVRPLSPPPGVDPGLWHMMVEGRAGARSLSPGMRWWHGTPRWAQAMQAALAGKLAGLGGKGDCGC
jgi:RHS repeat-associated protein